MPSTPDSPTCTRNTFRTVVPAAQLIARLTADRRPREERELDFSPWGGAYNPVPADATAFPCRDARFLLKQTATVAAGERPGGWLDESYALTHPYGNGGAYPRTRTFRPGLPPGQHGPATPDPGGLRPAGRVRRVVGARHEQPSPAAPLSAKPDISARTRRHASPMTAPMRRPPRGCQSPARPPRADDRRPQSGLAAPAVMGACGSAPVAADRKLSAAAVKPLQVRLPR
jgi:hypothetical protein